MLSLALTHWRLAGIIFTNVTIFVKCVSMLTLNTADDGARGRVKGSEYGSSRGKHLLHGNPSNSSWDIWVKNRNVNLMVALKEKSLDHQSEGLSSGDHECLFTLARTKVSTQAGWQSGGPTGRATWPFPLWVFQKEIVVECKCKKYNVLYCLSHWVSIGLHLECANMLGSPDALASGSSCLHWKTIDPEERLSSLLDKV